MDNSNDKLYGILSYIAPLWLIGLFAGNTEFTRFHVNHGIVLTITLVILAVIGGIGGLIAAFIPFIGWIIGGLFGLIVGAGAIAVLVLSIMGIVNVANGEMKELPVIGKIKIIK